MTEITVAKTLLTVVSQKYLLKIGICAASLSQLGMNSLQFMISKLDILIGISGKSSSGYCNVVELCIPP